MARAPATRNACPILVAVALLTTLLPANAQDSGGTLPDLLGDFFDGGARSVSLTAPLTVSFFAKGDLVLGLSPATVALERDGVGVPDDLFAIQATDGSGSPILNTFAVTDEPLPPSEIPTSPGDEFHFDGGTAVFTGSTTSTSPAAGAPPSTAGDYFVSYSYSQAATVMIPAGGGGVAVRRVKISENNNPLPRDRILFNYHFFNDVQGGLGDISRYTLGVEKTFLGGNASIEFRLPFAGTLDNEQTIGSPSDRNFEFGNAILLWKFLLARSHRCMLTAGSGFTLPLADSTELFMGDTNILRIANNAVHILPFVAAAWTPNTTWFGQAFVQFDFDPYGNLVSADVPTDLTALPVGVRSLPEIGNFNDASLLFVDIAGGAWLARNERANHVVGVAQVVELHYASTTSDTDVISGNGLTLSDLSRRLDVLNLTLATHFQCRRGLQVSSGFVIPLRDGNDKPFDMEYALQVDKTF